jgi:hypothetical protein
MLQKVQKTLFFVTSPKLNILIKNVLLYRKRTKKEHIRFGRLKSRLKSKSVKGLSLFLDRYWVL